MAACELSVTTARSSYRHFVRALADPTALCGAARPRSGWVETEIGNLLPCDRCTRKFFGGRMN